MAKYWVAIIEYLLCNERRISLFKVSLFTFVVSSNKSKNIFMTKHNCLVNFGFSEPGFFVSCAEYFHSNGLEKSKMENKYKDKKHNFVNIWYKISYIYDFGTRKNILFVTSNHQLIFTNLRIFFDQNNNFAKWLFLCITINLIIQEWKSFKITLERRNLRV